MVLGFESIIVFLGGLAVFGLNATPAGIPPWWGIVAGSTLALLMVFTSGVVRFRWGVLLGWVWQALVVLGGFVVPALVIVGVIFGLMYAYATIKGRALDRRNAARADASSPHISNGD